MVNKDASKEAGSVGGGGNFGFRSYLFEGTEVEFHHEGCSTYSTGLSSQKGTILQWGFPIYQIK